MGEFRRVPAMEDPYEYVERCPWKIACEPFRVAPHVWYVSGNTWVGAYLIDTGDGLILIDTFEVRALYLLTEAVRKAGFDPGEIKLILLSHGHADHCGGLKALQEMTKAKVYMSKEDYEVKKTHFDRVFFRPDGQDFEPDGFYSDQKTIELGTIRIRTKLCPGHTPGTTSFFFWDEDGEGKRYLCGMHGGAGTGFLSDEYLDDYGYPRWFRQRFVDDCKEMASWPVDICLASHPNMTNFLSGVNWEDPRIIRDLWTVAPGGILCWRERRTRRDWGAVRPERGERKRIE